jgi:hypothetical protein
MVFRRLPESVRKILVLRTAVHPGFPKRSVTFITTSTFINLGLHTTTQTTGSTPSLSERFEKPAAGAQKHLNYAAKSKGLKSLTI